MLAAGAALAEVLMSMFIPSQRKWSLIVSKVFWPTKWPPKGIGMSQVHDDIHLGVEGHQQIHFLALLLCLLVQEFLMDQEVCAGEWLPSPVGSFPPPSEPDPRSF